MIPTRAIKRLSIHHQTCTKGTSLKKFMGATNRRRIQLQTDGVYLNRILSLLSCLCSSCVERGGWCVACPTFSLALLVWESLLRIKEETMERIAFNVSLFESDEIVALKFYQEDGSYLDLQLVRPKFISLDNRDGDYLEAKEVFIKVHTGAANRESIEATPGEAAQLIDMFYKSMQSDVNPIEVTHETHIYAGEAPNLTQADLQGGSDASHD